MKKCLVLLALLGIIGCAAWGEEGFAVDGLVLGQPEMEAIAGGQQTNDTFDDGFPTFSKGGIVENPVVVDDLNKLHAMGYLARQAEKLLNVENIIEQVLHPIKNVRKIINRYLGKYRDY